MTRVNTTSFFEDLATKVASKYGLPMETMRQKVDPDAALRTQGLDLQNQLDQQKLAVGNQALEAAKAQQQVAATPGIEPDFSLGQFDPAVMNSLFGTQAELPQAPQLPSPDEYLSPYKQQQLTGRGQKEYIRLERANDAIKKAEIIARTSPLAARRLDELKQQFYRSADQANLDNEIIQPPNIQDLAQRLIMPGEDGVDHILDESNGSNGRAELRVRTDDSRATAMTAKAQVEAQREANQIAQETNKAKVQSEQESIDSQKQTERRNNFVEFRQSRADKAGGESKQIDEVKKEFAAGWKADPRNKNKPVPNKSPAFFRKIIQDRDLNDYVAREQLQQRLDDIPESPTQWLRKEAKKDFEKTQALFLKIRNEMIDAPDADYGESGVPSNEQVIRRMMASSPPEFMKEIDAIEASDKEKARAEKLKMTLEQSKNNNKVTKSEADYGSAIEELSGVMNQRNIKGFNPEELVTDYAVKAAAENGESDPKTYVARSVAKSMTRSPKEQANNPNFATMSQMDRLQLEANRTPTVWGTPEEVAKKLEDAGISPGTFYFDQYMNLHRVPSAEDKPSKKEEKKEEKKPKKKRTGRQ